MNSKFCFPQIEALSVNLSAKALEGVGVYVITNLTNGRQYIGMTAKQCNGQRWNMHMSALERGKHHNSRLQADYNEPRSMFSFEMVVSCCPDEAALVEREFIERLSPYYNFTRRAAIKAA